MVGYNPADGVKNNAAPMAELIVALVISALPARRINFAAWGLAVLSGASIWMLIFKLI